MTVIVLCCVLVIFWLVQQAVQQLTVTCTSTVLASVSSRIFFVKTFPLQYKYAIVSSFFKKKQSHFFHYFLPYLRKKKKKDYRLYLKFN